VFVSGHTVAPLLVQASSLRRCIGNLVENAVRYGHRARLSLVDDGDQLTVSVADDGPGIAPAELERVLLPFYRVESSRNRDHGGVGLGLAIASDLAQRHGGSLRLINGVQGGMVATVTLPRKPF
jgi:signal transduction histidine kinase